MAAGPGLVRGTDHVRMRAIYEPTGQAREYAALACNLYRGCTHGCLYCYAPACLRIAPEDFHSSGRPRPGILQKLEQDAKRLSPVYWVRWPARRGVTVITNRTPGPAQAVLLCFTCDPYQPDERAHETTREAIGMLRQYGFAVQVLTKGGMRASRDFSLLNAPGCAFGTTLCWTDDLDRQHWEPGAAPIESRVQAIKVAHSLGIRTCVSVEPIIVPEQAISLIDELSPWADEWRVGKLNYHPLAEEIDWGAWAPRILAALQASGREYLVKSSLRQYLPAGAEAERGLAVA